MKRLILALILLATPAHSALACPQAFLGYGYTQAYYAAPAQYYAPQQYVQSDVLARIAALRAEIAALEAQATQQYTQQQTGYYSAPAPVVLQQVVVRRRAYALEQVAIHDNRGVVRRALDFVLGPPRRAPLRQQLRQQQLRQFRRHH